MNLGDSIAEDLATFDGTEIVTLATAAGSTTVTDALVRELSQDALKLVDNALSSELNQREFHLMVARVGSVQPSPGDDVIDSSGRRWRVQSSRLAALATRWQLQCTRLP
ncbi:MAG TPA: hypothetical protein VG713_11070 [Pirellulales bacterium]|nr:hypothetical protein [Pirellulales bacterium]